MTARVPIGLLFRMIALVVDVAECSGHECCCLPAREIAGRSFPAVDCLTCRAARLMRDWKAA